MVSSNLRVMDTTLCELILIVMIFTSSHQVPLTCPDTGQRTLGTSVSYSLDKDFIWCSDSMNETVFRILEQINISQTTAKLCLGLENFHRRIYGHHKTDVFIQKVFFNSTLPVGIVTVNRICWEKERSSRCLGRLTVLDKVLELGVFKYFPYTKEFWNFESTLYGTTMEWFLSLHVEEQIEPCSISSKWIENLQNTSLRELSIVCAQCNQQSDEFFLRDMPYLQKLHLFVVCIKNFHNDSFSGTPNLEDVTFSAGDLKYIPTVVTHFTKLKKLDISYNDFKELVFIEDQSLPQLHNLEYLSMTGSANIGILVKFPMLTKLTSLILQNCGIITLERYAFKNISQLETLDMSWNSITSIDKEAFFSLHNLKNVDLSHNSLITWPVLYYCSLLKLKLYRNKLTGLTNPSIFGTTINHLDVSHNNISEWDDLEIFSFNNFDMSKRNVFVGKNNIEEYDLSSIVLITNNTQNHDSSYQKVEDKKLSPISSKKWLKILDISDNAINRLTHTMLKSINGIEHVLLSNNPFDCRDCTIPEFQTWINRTRTKITKFESILCYEPHTDKDKPVIEIQFDLKACVVKGSNYGIILGFSLGIILSVFLVITVIYFWFRSKIVYMLHLHRIRKEKITFTKNFNFDAIVCYSSGDQRFVLTVLAPLLENSPERYKLCLHEHDFGLDSHIVDNIEGAIEQRRKTILILSPHFINSKWCNWELEMANSKMFDNDEQYLIIIQVAHIDKDIIPPHLKSLTGTRMFLNLTEEAFDSTVKDMERELKKFLGKSNFLSSREQDLLLDDDRGEIIFL